MRLGLVRAATFRISARIQRQSEAGGRLYAAVPLCARSCTTLSKHTRSWSVIGQPVSDLRQARFSARAANVDPIAASPNAWPRFLRQCIGSRADRLSAFPIHAQPTRSHPTAPRDARTE